MKAKFKVGDKLRILDGSKISNYRGSWNDDMKKLVGNIVTVESIREPWGGFHVGYRMKECGFLWDERGLELVESEQITINRYGNKVVAKMGKKVGVARCNETDTFDLYTGVKIATDRLFGKESEVKEVKRHAKVGEYVKIVRASAVPETNGKPDYKNGDILKVIDVDVQFSQVRYAEDTFESNRSRVLNNEEYVVLENYKPQTEKQQEEKPKYYNGKTVCVRSNGNFSLFTVGKIYEFKDGVTKMDCEIISARYKSINQFNKVNKDYELIELVEDK